MSLGGPGPKLPDLKRYFISGGLNQPPPSNRVKGTLTNSKIKTTSIVDIDLDDWGLS